MLGTGHATQFPPPPLTVRIQQIPVCQQKSAKWLMLAMDPNFGGTKLLQMDLIELYLCVGVRM